MMNKVKNKSHKGYSTMELAPASSYANYEQSNSFEHHVFISKSNHIHKHLELGVQKCTVVDVDMIDRAVNQEHENHSPSHP